MVTLLNYSAPDSGIQHSEPLVTMTVGVDDIGNGMLYITESNVLWLNNHGQGIQLEYRQICLHAVSRDLQAFPREHLLCHYEGKLPGSSQADSADEENEDNDSEIGMTEIRFAPDNKDSLDAMFQALATCQSLHPDSDCLLSDDDDFEDAEEEDEMAGGDVIYNSEEGLQNLTEEGQATMERLNQLLLAGQQQGAGDSNNRDADIAEGTERLHITNGHHTNGDTPMDADQFLDADDETN
ncbi:methylosome subunit picln [Plakobranchus ocellatus]|uniref:Methylosome subunit pICln n=1 Tax=Plakobranchus ocellatus TaxID=259542 RepID=A0AAV4C6Z9_9GAST|nr:methylosome subunit picln [Plakobranchus ocellatus]